MRVFPNEIYLMLQLGKCLIHKWSLNKKDCSTEGIDQKALKRKIDCKTSITSLSSCPHLKRP